jgi:hypothetical protein
MSADEDGKPGARDHIPKSSTSRTPVPRPHSPHPLPRAKAMPPFIPAHVSPTLHTHGHAMRHHSGAISELRARRKALSNAFRKGFLKPCVGGFDSPGMTIRA